MRNGRIFLVLIELDLIFNNFNLRKVLLRRRKLPLSLFKQTLLIYERLNIIIKSLICLLEQYFLQLERLSEIKMTLILLKERDNNHEIGMYFIIILFISHNIAHDDIARIMKPDSKNIVYHVVNRVVIRHFLL